MTVWRSSGHRGDVLEELLLVTNDYYKSNGLGRIDKISTPVKVIQIDKNKMITKAFFEKKSTVDFHGLIQGMGIAFDAKETTLKSIPLQNIHPHQVEYMKDINDQRGLAFLIAHFKFCDEYYLIPFEILWKYYNNEGTTRKSIPYKAMLPEFQIERTVNGILNYLPTLNAYMKFKRDYEK